MVDRPFFSLECQMSHTESLVCPECSEQVAPAADFGRRRCQRNGQGGQGSGLIACMSGYVGRTYTYDVMFGTTKTATDRMARDMGVELKPHGVASVSLWQGFTYTERAIANLKTVPGMASQLNSAVGSSPEFVGRVIAALAVAPDLLSRTGGSWIVAELAQAYGVTDVFGEDVGPPLGGIAAAKLGMSAPGLIAARISAAAGSTS